MSKCRSRNNHTPQDSEAVNPNRIITAQQFGYDASNKNWKVKKVWRVL